MYTGGTVVTIDLADERVCRADAAEIHVERILADCHPLTYFYQPTDFTSGVLPGIPNHCAFYAYPTLLNTRPWPFGFAKTALQIRNIARVARRPVFVPGPAAKRWRQVAGIIDESSESDDVVSLAQAIAFRAHVPLTLFSTKDVPAGPLQDGKPARIAPCRLDKDLYAICSESLVVSRACQYPLIWDFLAGDSVRRIQSHLPNPLVVVGPNCQQNLRHSTE
jgi:hypothetical protein